LAPTDTTEQIGTMIVGQFLHNERLIIPVSVLDSDGEYREIEATIDTGFVGGLLLPTQTVQELELPRLGATLALLADGTMTRLPTYIGTVLWGEEEREIEIIAAARDLPLVGVELLLGSTAHFEFFEGGEVSIEPEG
jgi:clan AA aspartic protease